MLYNLAKSLSGSKLKKDSQISIWYHNFPKQCIQLVTYI